MRNQVKDDHSKKNELKARMIDAALQGKWFMATSLGTIGITYIMPGLVIGFTIEFHERDKAKTEMERKQLSLSEVIDLIDREDAV